MTNILSIDFEDWNQLIARRVRGQLGNCNHPALDRQVDALLALLQESQTFATFFVLGVTAERNKPLVKRIAIAGHEIALHGYGHLQVFRMTRKEFAEDTRHGKQLVEDLTGEQVFGYRAAEFSVDRSSLWALEVLAEQGFVYDSSIFPVRHRRYGIPDFAPQPARYSLANGSSIVEIPLTSVQRFGIRLPVAGGGYFRLLPQAMLQRIVADLWKGGTAFNSYLHPYEFDPEPLRFTTDGARHSLRATLRAAFLNFHQNLGRASIPGKVRALLTGFRFGTCSQYLREAKLDECRELLPNAR